MIRNFLEGFAALLFLASCSTVPTAANSPIASPKYELMLSGTIDGNAFQGVGVGSAAPQHSIKIVSAIPVDYFEMQSCHRSVQFSNVITGDPVMSSVYKFLGLDSGNKSFTFEYDEAPTIEDDGECILRFCAYSKTVGSPPSACAIVDFKSPNYDLPFENICNGVDGQTSGTAICHTRVGLIERVRLASPSHVAPQVSASSTSGAYWIAGQCQGHFIDAKQTIFEYTVPTSECSVRFDTIDQPHHFGKLTVVPYDTPVYAGGSN